jgi:hypothetical protein
MTKPDDRIRTFEPPARMMGGMIEKTWSGHPMWECPRCGGTTFESSEAKVHTCKEVRTVDDLPPEER